MSDTPHTGIGRVTGAAPIPSFPEYERGERRADAVVHAIGGTASSLAGLWLMVGATLPEGDSRWSLIVYAVGMVGMFASSGAYNLAPPGETKASLRRLDHAMIFAAIAGTYTPLLILRMPSGIGVTLCVVIWILAMIGAGLKVAAPGRHERLGLFFYLGLGWMGLPAVPFLTRTLHPATLHLIAYGGALYTVGAGIQLLTRIRYHNVMWHVLVLAAACCHFLAMRREFTVPPAMM